MKNNVIPLLIFLFLGVTLNAQNIIPVHSFSPKYLSEEYTIRYEEDTTYILCLENSYSMAYYDKQNRVKYKIRYKCLSNMIPLDYSCPPERMGVITYSYDKNNELESATFYDKNNRLNKVLYYDKNNQIENGTFYDKNNRLTKVLYYDKNNLQTILQYDEYQQLLNKKENVYDINNNLIEIKYYKGNELIESGFVKYYYINKKLIGSRTIDYESGYTYTNASYPWKKKKQKRRYPRKKKTNN